jgi:hypothetical protein
MQGLWGCLIVLQSIKSGLNPYGLLNPSFQKGLAQKKRALGEPAVLTCGPDGLTAQGFQDLVEHLFGVAK